MAYYDEHDPEDEKKVGGVWLKGHQDHGGECSCLAGTSGRSCEDQPSQWSFLNRWLPCKCGMTMVPGATPDILPEVLS